MGDGAACEYFLRALKSERCKAQIGTPSRSPAPKAIEPLLAFARRALLATSGRPISDAERAAAHRLHLMLISARPFEPARAYADLLLLEKSRVEVLLFRAGALREALGPDLANQPQIERTLADLRRRLAAF